MKHLVKIHRRLTASTEQRLFDILRHLIEACAASPLESSVQAAVRLLNMKYLDLRVHGLTAPIGQQLFDILRHSTFFPRLSFLRHRSFLCTWPPSSSFSARSTTIFGLPSLHVVRNSTKKKEEEEARGKERGVADRKEEIWDTGVRILKRDEPPLFDRVPSQIGYLTSSGVATNLCHWSLSGFLRPKSRLHLYKSILSEETVSIATCADRKLAQS